MMSTPSPENTVYFAYGSNMCHVQMAQRCPGASSQGRALLPQHRFIINSRGYASIVPHSQSLVHGVIWHLTDEHVKVLDHYEDVALDLYRRVSVVVLTECGTRTFPAMTYVSTFTNPGKPRMPYLQSIINAAHRQQFPEDYRQELESWLG